MVYVFTPNLPCSFPSLNSVHAYFPYATGRRVELMCFVCDSISEPCPWQLAHSLRQPKLTLLAGRRRLRPCYMCDEEADEFVTELGLKGIETYSIGCQVGSSALTLEAGQAANAEVRRSAVGRNRVPEIGTTSPSSKIRAALDFP